MNVQAELEAQIVDDPDDPARYLVYADYLLTRDDIRGELITLHAQPKAMRALLDQHRAALLGPLAAHVDSTVEIEWFMGFVKRATIASPSAEQILEALAAVLASPAAMFLQELVIEPHALLPIDPKRVVAALLAAARPQTLAYLSLGKPGSWTPPPALREAFPRLARDPTLAWAAAMTKAATQRKLKIEVDAAHLPALVPRVAGIAVDVPTILAGLKAELDKQRPLGVLAAMPHVFERESLDAFALALAKEWQQIGESPRWPFDALGPLGGDRCVRWIAAQLAGWSHQRAVQAIQHLVRIGSDAALYEVVTLALAPRAFGARRSDAASALDIVAKARGLRDRDALIVRIAPTAATDRVLATQRRWLEDAMLAGVRIPVDDFRRHVAGNPIRRTLATSLVWAVFEPAPALFRVDPTGWLARLDGTALDPRGEIGLPHPAELAPDDIATARRAIDEQPILQLARPVYTAERLPAMLKRFARQRVGYYALQTVFDQRGWTELLDGALTTAWSKTFPRDSVVATAVLDERAGAIESVDLRRGGFGPPLELAALHPVTLSELLWDLDAAHATAEPVVAPPVERPRPVTVERAKSGRSKCVVCGQPIAKGEQRIGVERRVETVAYTGRSTVWVHPACRAGAPELADVDVDALLDQ